MSVSATAKRMTVVKEVAHGCAPTTAIIAAPGMINAGPDPAAGLKSDTVSLESRHAIGDIECQILRDEREVRIISTAQGLGERLC
jgi:hypothetical protein